MRRALVVLLLAFAIATGARSAPVRAEDGAEETRSGRPLPPRVRPARRGASARRAEALGLGSVDVARHLLRRAPEERWVRAAATAGAMPEELTWPVDTGRFGRGFGFVRRTRPDLRHDGVDIVAERGTAVHAVAPGIVAYSGDEMRGYGNVLVIVHPNGWATLYAHLVRATVPAGYRVAAGERIAFVGSTGRSTGPHVHFELHVAGRAVNPLEHFGGRPWIEAYRRWQALRSEDPEWQPDDDFLDPELAPEAPRVAGGRVTIDTDEVDEHTHGPADAEREDAEAEPEAEDAEAEPEAEDAVVVDPEAVARARAALTGSLVRTVAGRRFGTLLWPLRRGVRAADYAQPRGVNLVATDSQVVRAAADGEVVFVGHGLSGVGLAMVVLHADGRAALYGGLAECHVSPGERVARGEWIAHIADTPDAHLHFQVREAGAPLELDPLFVGAP